MTALYAVRTKDVVAIPRSVAGIILGDISLRAPIRWALIAYIPETLGFQEAERLTDYGAIFTQSISFSIKQDRPEVMQILEDLRQAELCFVTVDQLGRMRVIGTPDAPARMLSIALVEAKSSGLNGYQCTAQALSAVRAPFYEGVLNTYTPLTFYLGPDGHLYMDNVQPVPTTATINGSGHLEIDNMYNFRYFLNRTNAAFT